MDSSCIHSSSTPFDCIVFDLDDTLYSSKTGIDQALKRNIDDFLVERLGFPESQAPTLRAELFKIYGSSLVGLRSLGYDVDADDYHSVVHGRLPYDLIKPDAKLQNLLHTIKQRKIIFTNSDKMHAMKALNRLGIKDCFEQIICFETMNPNLSKSTTPVVLKPSTEAMKIAIDFAEVDPQRTLFLDDNVKNVAAGKAAGLWTVLRGRRRLLSRLFSYSETFVLQNSVQVGKAIKSKVTDYALETITNLVQVIPEIWYSEEDDQSISHTKNEMNSILSATAFGA